MGAFIFCFTSYSFVHWIAPTIGITVLCAFEPRLAFSSRAALTGLALADFGLYLIYLSAFNYVAEAYTLYASSALSAMSFVRNIVGAVFPRASLPPRPPPDPC